MRSFALATFLGACSVLAGTKCSLDSPCPSDAPCCSQYGECGVGAYCLGGCDPRMSYKLDSCAPAPVCKDMTTKFDSLDSAENINKYLGDASKADWVYQGYPAIHDGSVLLTMPKGSVGTVMASTRYMWYGNVKAKFKTSRGKGVVTAFILFSDVKDEIDYEFVGVDLETAQTNYYFQGITDYHNSGNITLSDTFHNYHEYEIRWTPDKIEWLVDGQVGRTKKKSDTWNSTSQNYDFPQTPSRVQLSIWPGGLASNAKGTIDWAGGEIDWNAEDIKNAGYFYTAFQEVSIECYNAKSAPGTNKNKSYTYKSAKGTNDTVVDGDKDTVMGSFLADGEHMDEGKSTASASADKPKKTQAQIPGGGNGATGQDHSGSSTGSGGNSGGSGGSGGGSSGGSGGGSSGGGSGCDIGSFSQDCGDSDSSSKDKDSNGKSSGSKASASSLAMIVAGCALFML